VLTEAPEIEPVTRRRFSPWLALSGFLVTFAVLTVWLARPPEGARLATPEELTENFVRVAFGPQQTVRLWQMPLRIALMGEGAEQFAPVASEVARTFTALTKVDARVVPHGAEAFNVLIQIVPPADYGRIAARAGAGIKGGEYLADHTVCYTLTSIQGRVRRATVAIPDTLPEREIAACIHHELMHVFGFQGHPEAGFDSALGRSRAITRNDLVLLRTLYDPRLRGNGAQFRESARALIEEHAAVARTAKDPAAALARTRNVSGG
jgi:hypothetical protein